MCKLVRNEHRTAAAAHPVMLISHSSIRGHGQCPQIGLHRPLKIKFVIKLLHCFFGGITACKIQLSDSGFHGSARPDAANNKNRQAAEIMIMFFFILIYPHLSVKSHKYFICAYILICFYFGFS